MTDDSPYLTAAHWETVRDRLSAEGAKTPEPILIAINDSHVRHLGEPDPKHYEVAKCGPAHRLIHAMARTRTLGFYCKRPVLRMSREYAATCDALFVTPGESIFPPPVGVFRGVPVYIDEGSNCVVVDCRDVSL